MDTDTMYNNKRLEILDNNLKAIGFEILSIEKKLMKSTEKNDLARQQLEKLMSQYKSNNIFEIVDQLTNYIGDLDKFEKDIQTVNDNSIQNDYNHTELVDNNEKDNIVIDTDKINVENNDINFEDINFNTDYDNLQDVDYTQNLNLTDIQPDNIEETNIDEDFESRDSVIEKEDSEETVNNENNDKQFNDNQIVQKSPMINKILSIDEEKQKKAIIVNEHQFRKLEESLNRQKTLLENRGILNADIIDNSNSILNTLIYSDKKITDTENLHEDMRLEEQYNESLKVQNNKISEEKEIVNYQDQYSTQSSFKQYQQQQNEQEVQYQEPIVDQEEVSSNESIEQQYDYYQPQNYYQVQSDNETSLPTNNIQQDINKVVDMNQTIAVPVPDQVVPTYNEENSYTQNSSTYEQTSVNDIEKAMEEAKQLYDAGQFEEAQKAYDRISQMNQMLNAHSTPNYASTIQQQSDEGGFSYVKAS